MSKQKERQVLSELMQYGYDRNVIALTDMKGNSDIEKQFDELTRRTIKSCREWFNTTDRHFEDAFKRRTTMRFCFTVGIGAAWFWENRMEEVKEKGLYECMSEPRGEDMMDEYIIDMVGIWWSPQSL